MVVGYDVSNAYEYSRISCLRESDEMIIESTRR